MATLVILPAKFKQDVQNYVFNFSNILEPVEIIESAELSVSVFTGIDEDPEHILVGDLVYTDKQVSQVVQLGVIGVIYEFSVRVVTDLDRAYVIQARLAILPEADRAGTRHATLILSSKLYPIEFSDALRLLAEPLDGSLRKIIVELSTKDALRYTAAPVTGSLRYAYVEYVYPEALRYDPEPLSGSLRDALHEYTYPEKLRYVPEPRSGMLRAALVSHTYEESLRFSPEPLSGTLYVP